MGNWSSIIRDIIRRYDVSNLFCKTVNCSGYSYIDDSILINKDVIRSLESRARFRNEKDIYCMKEYFYRGRQLEDIAKELGVTDGRIHERIRKDVWRLWLAARKIYGPDDWRDAYE